MVVVFIKDLSSGPVPGFGGSAVFGQWSETEGISSFAVSHATTLSSRSDLSASANSTSASRTGDGTSPHHRKRPPGSAQLCLRSLAQLSAGQVTAAGRSSGRTRRFHPSTGDGASSGPSARRSRLRQRLVSLVFEVVVRCCACVLVGCCDMALVTGVIWGNSAVISSAVRPTARKRRRSGPGCFLAGPLVRGLRPSRRARCPCRWWPSRTAAGWPC